MPGIKREQELTNISLIGSMSASKERYKMPTLNIILARAIYSALRSLYKQERGKVNTWRKLHRSKPEVHERELVAGRLHEERRNPKRAAYKSEYSKKYYLANKGKLIQQAKDWANNNREKYLSSKKKYHHSNKPQRNAKSREYHQRNRLAALPKLRAYNAKLRIENPERVKLYGRTTRLNAKRNPARTLKLLNRTRIYQAFKRYLKGAKTKRSSELLGCSFEFLRTYLESRFKPGMNWENRGVKGWHIDHIKPCDSFDLSNPEEQKVCFHYSNLQPLWWDENLRKGALCPVFKHG